MERCLQIMQLFLHIFFFIVNFHIFFYEPDMCASVCVVYCLIIYLSFLSLFLNDFNLSKEYLLFEMSLLIPLQFVSFKEAYWDAWFLKLGLNVKKEASCKISL